MAGSSHPILPSPMIASCTVGIRLHFILRVLLWVSVAVPAMGDSNSSSSSDKDSESDSSMVKGLLAGLGGFVGVIVFICLLWCCCCSDDDNSCKCSSSCFGKKGAKSGHPYEDHGPGHDPARPPRHSKDKSKVSPSPPLQTGNLRAPSQWSHNSAR